LVSSDKKDKDNAQTLTPPKIVTGKVSLILTERKEGQESMRK
jgi:hypothetical protein